MTIIGKLWDCALGCGRDRSRHSKKVFWILKCSFWIASNHWLSIQGGAYILSVCSILVAWFFNWCHFVTYLYISESLRCMCVWFFFLMTLKWVWFQYSKHIYAHKYLMSVYCHCFSFCHTVLRRSQIDPQFNLNCTADLIILTIKLSFYADFSKRRFSVRCVCVFASTFVVWWIFRHNILHTHKAVSRCKTSKEANLF